MGSRRDRDKKYCMLSLDRTRRDMADIAFFIEVKEADSRKYKQTEIHLNQSQ